MKTIIVILSTVALVGCGAVPVKRNFPDKFNEPDNSCPKLKEAELTTKKPSELLQIINENYATYYKCAAVKDGWDEWYAKQKKNFEEVK